MHINSKLNLVTAIDRDNGPIYVHSMPVSRETFERYYKVIAKTFANIYTNGLDIVAGPRVAAIMIKEVAQSYNLWDGVDGVSNGFMAELRRLSNVALPTVDGWQTVPFQTALDKGLIDDDEAAEVEGIICFFIVVSAMHRKNDAKNLLSLMPGLWGARTEQLSFMAFVNSLPTLIEIETSAPLTTLSVPS